ncbi:MAG: NHLP bacteriocin export ABC transporter permease/ATPase subunit [Spirochaetes bacterium GWF1_31_7]|nr:MAG: NHLP bacteriocin export ABC transporter permease/ATPase subunit [Spirochaetes bacterium GWE1_32_154]OHD48146.1 MAG: NHLP bacteriocin export ABC transporter permease/ATPase subunit [Spirochaetes bacterium GWE2_31_10]OHD50499.1 MAG: NHLP bacteriocin export ABC transporter permease/ATPase subunit [Spirochaetes bacterium GWF1_31_7]HBD94696.1 NHLP bacteriocin export ABC transporter permease/ATPase subunit [Spirochaetia bacterium]HBI36626.1 NHLP bacteriocin export ABC transporter permease/ATP
MEENDMKLEKYGKLHILDSRKPFVFDHPESVWVVIEGSVDVFYGNFKDSIPQGVRNYFFTATKEMIITCFNKNDELHQYLLFGAGAPGTKVIELDYNDFKSLAAHNETSSVSNLIDTSLQVLLSRFFTKQFFTRKKDLECNENFVLDENETGWNNQDIQWIKISKGSVYINGNRNLTLTDKDNYYPIIKNSCITAIDYSIVTVKKTSDIIQNDRFFYEIIAVYTAILELYYANDINKKKAEKDRIVKKINEEDYTLRNSLNSLAEVMNPLSIEKKISHDSDIVAALKIIGEYLDVEIKIPPGNKTDLVNLVRESNLQIRQVILKGTWWTGDNGVLLAYMKDDETPVALIPSAHNYTMYNHKTGKHQKVDAEVALDLKSYAFCFYKPFPDKIVTIKDLLVYSLNSVKKYDIVSLFFVSMFAGVLNLVFPVITGILFNSIIPDADKNSLIFAGLLLLVTIGSGLIFQITKLFTLQRIETKVEFSLQSALWERLINLPSSFFKKYTSGDLVKRANGISLIRRELSGGLIASLLSGIFSIFNLSLLFFYNVNLAFISLLLSVFSIIITISFGMVITYFERKIVAIDGTISGLLLQIINGIAKIKISGSEDKAFSLWSSVFSKKRKYTYQSDLIASYLSIFNVFYPVCTSIIIFYIVSKDNQVNFSVGTFIAFIASFTIFMTAMLELTRNIISGLQIIPLYERVKPILETLPEKDVHKADPGILDGMIDINHVTFRYSGNSPAVLKDISVNIKPGEFVAFVGPSGSGKSTLMRLLLGFETPESGNISFSGQDMSTVDISAIRKQMGVVLQNSKIMAGDIYSNIIGASTELTMDDVWDALEMCGLDDDIKEMPMGLHTVISEGGGTLSGGQRQRLLIARAIVNKPKIILFDEATSALDNITQATVSKSIEKLKNTRIVIAHRLSTIINADTIYVLVNGNIVEKGSYQELINENGHFTELAKRQIV